jgi:flagella basal body P-ring formation protein FlgA
MRALTLISTLLLAAGPALAGPVTLRANPVDDDGRVTLGDIFDGAGAASGVVVASRAGPSVVFEAGQLQALAARSGLQWANPQNLRRVVVRNADLAPGAPAPTLAATSTAARPAAVSGATVPVLTYARNIASGEIVQPEDVIWADVQSHLAPAGGPSDAEQVIGLSARRALRAGTVVGNRDLVAQQVIARNDTIEVAFVSGGVTLTVTGRAQRAAAVGETLSVTNLTSGRTIEAVASGPGRAIAGPQAQAARSNLFAVR